MSRSAPTPPPPSPSKEKEPKKEEVVGEEAKQEDKEQVDMEP
jgi:hypothetical protein